MLLSRFVSCALAPLAIACGFYLALCAPALPQNTGTARAPSMTLAQDYEVAGVKVQLLSLKRTSDGLLTLRWAYRNTSTSPKTVGANTTAAAMSPAAPYSLAVDVYLMSGGTQYKVAQAGSALLAGTHAGPEKTIVVLPAQTYATWAKFRDPGPDVKTVTVFIEGTAPFEDVPIG